MKISLNWLREYVDIQRPIEEIEYTLNKIGFEVENVTRCGADLSTMVVGMVLDCQPHPNADLLRHCVVDVGDDEPLSIVCGAPNVKKGQKVCVAKVGCVLYDSHGVGISLKKRKIRGMVSMGMICSSYELWLGLDAEGIIVLDTNLNVGTSLNKLFPNTLDTIFDLNITPNRPDANSHIGIARELAAYYKMEMNYALEPKLDNINITSSGAVPVTIEDTKGCFRYSAVLLENVKVTESPIWLKIKLLAVGLRPINNVVDITNYILYATGQPLHAFDYNKFSKKGVVVRQSEHAQKFHAIDDKIYDVPAGSLFICDGNKNVVALAGIIGGHNTEVDNDTHTVIIECAWFDPVTVRKTAKKINISTDASYRFERGVDISTCSFTAILAANMITKYGTGDINSEISDVLINMPSSHKVRLRHDRVNAILGKNLRIKEIERILQRLGIEVKVEKSYFDCVIPTFRRDILKEIDLIEEIDRMYDSPHQDISNILKVSRPIVQPQNIGFEEKLLQVLVQCGLNEIITNSLLSEEKARLYVDHINMIKSVNASSKEMEILRFNLWHGGLSAIHKNICQGVHGVRFFEIGQVFRLCKDDGVYFENVEEKKQLTIFLYGYKVYSHWQHSNTFYNIYDMVGIVENVLCGMGIKSYSKTVDKQNVLCYGYKKNNMVRVLQAPQALIKAYGINSHVYIAEFDIKRMLNYASMRIVDYKPISMYPSLHFDIAFEVSHQVKAENLRVLIHQYGGKWLNSVKIFDVFEGGNLPSGKKSMAFHLEFLNHNQTLKQKDILSYIDRIVYYAKKRYDAILRDGNFGKK